MKKALSLCALAAFLAVIASGCAGSRARSGVIPGVGMIYTNWKAPLMTNYAGGDFGTKQGRAKTQYIMVPWPITLDVAWGDAALRQAAKDGGISTVKAADYEYMSILGIYQEFTVHAYGD